MTTSNSSGMRRTVQPGARQQILRPSLQYTWGGVNLHAELHRLAALCTEDLQVRPPSLVLHKVKRPRMVVGLASCQEWAIQIWLWPELPLGAVLATLVHELAHFCAPTDLRHGERFRAAMLELARDAYGVVLPWHQDNRRVSHLDFLLEFELFGVVCDWWKSRRPWPLLNERCAMPDEGASCAL